MRIDTYKQYNKAWSKLNKQQQVRVLGALELFVSNPYEPSIRLHQLKGHYYPQYSISAGGDLRIHFMRVSKDNVILTMVGTHAQLYG